MTDNIKSLVERLNDRATYLEAAYAPHTPSSVQLLKDAAARIAELEARPMGWVWCDSIYEEHCHSTDEEAIAEGWRPLVCSDLSAPVADSAMAKDAERLDILEIKLRVERAKVERLVQILSAIHGLLNPQDVKLDDGRTMRFSKPEFQIECYRQLSERIRKIPESLDAAIEASAEKERS